MKTIKLFSIEIIKTSMIFTTANESVHWFVTKSNTIRSFHQLRIMIRWICPSDRERGAQDFTETAKRCAVCFQLCSVHEDDHEKEDIL